MLPLESLPPPPGSPPRILVVHAGDTQARALERALLDEGYRVDVQSRGAAVADDVHRDPPDLILLQVELPDACGYELCGDLRMMDESHLTPIVLLSDVPADEGEVVRGLLSGADDFVHRPERLLELKARVRVQLRNRRDREMLQWTRKQRATFRTAAMVDTLTGIPNRRAAEHVIAEALNQREPFMVLLVDVDRFKSVNDTHGHVVGDVVLQHVAKTLDRQTRKGDVVARFGGEEFVVLIRGAAPSLARVIAERFRAAVERIPFTGLEVDGVTVSIGVAPWDGVHPAPSRERLLESADAAMYSAKEAGRNRVALAALHDVKPMPVDDAGAEHLRSGTRDTLDSQRAPRAEASTRSTRPCKENVA